MSAATVVELDGAPGLGGVYGRGTAHSGRLAVGRRIGTLDREVAAGALPSVEYLVRDVHCSAAHLSAYQHLLGEPGDHALPAGFVHVLAFPVATALMVRSDFPLPLVGMVHLANTVEQREQLRHGDALQIRAWAQGLRPHRAGVQLDLVVEVRRDVPPGPAGAVAPTGPAAWRGVSTYLAKGIRMRGAAREQPHASGALAPTEPRTAELATADLLPTAEWALAADTGRRYATVSGDRNPIHLSALTAKAFGFPRAIAHGMYTASRALATIGAARGEAFTWTVEFAKPVLLPGTVSLRVARNPDPARAGFVYTGWNPRSGKVHFTGEVTPSHR